MKPALTKQPKPAFLQIAPANTGDASKQLLAGIDAEQPFIPPWYLYDTIGSRLFDVITVLPNYYPTRTEIGILEAHMTAMVDARNVTGSSLIDLGAGSCEKAPRLFEAVQPAQYVPIDISVDYLRNRVAVLQAEHPDIEMIGIGTDFSQTLVLPDAVQASPRLFFYPGSSIGNYEPKAAREFLQRVHGQMDENATLWIGVDLVKDTPTLERAYDDELGVTAAFNKNILRNVNRIAGTNFTPADWRHVALYNEEQARIEMHLEATRELLVSWSNGQRKFAAGERIHTENSHKFTLDSFQELLASVGLQTIDIWTDERRWFAFFVAAPAT